MTGEPTDGASPREHTSLGTGLVSNIAANAVIAVAFILSVPLLVSYIGVEGYGLIGFFVVAQSIALVLDLGLNVVLTREFAVGRPSDLRVLLRTSEVIYAAAALLIAVGWTLSAGYLSFLVNPVGISAETLHRSFLLMGPAIALQIPISLYSGALFGLQKQAAVSGVGAVFSVLRNLGAVPLLHIISPEPQVYFAWQLFCAAMHLPILAILTWNSLPGSDARTRFDLHTITAKWRFALGVGSVTLGTTLLAHLDKFVIVRLLSLEAFGLYSIAATAAGGLHWLIQPVFRAILPRLAKHAEGDRQEDLSHSYHNGSQLMALIVFPIAAGWIFFAYELLLVWQQSAAIANGAYLVVALLMAGGVLNAIQHLPYALQLSLGKTRLHRYAVFSALVIALPLTILMTLSWGQVGAAAVNIVIYALILIFVIPALHRYVLRGEALRWFGSDIVLPAAMIAAAGGVCRILFVDTDSTTLLLAQLAGAFAIMGLAGVLASSYSRRWLQLRLDSFRL
jgi:O-antigen/teichoic acid export membrane protein